MPSSLFNGSSPDSGSNLEPSANEERTDAAVYAAAQQGNTQALGTLYHRHSGLVYGISLKVLGNTQAAEDLTQDIFVMLASTQRYNPNRGSLRTYLAVLTRSRAIDRLRSKGTAHRKVNQLQAQQNLLSLSNVPLEKVSQQEQNGRLQTALSQLSEAEQQILNMMYFEGLSQSAIAQKLNIPLGTVKTRSRRGLLKLRQILVNPVPIE